MAPSLSLTLCVVTMTILVMTVGAACATDGSCTGEGLQAVDAASPAQPLLGLVMIVKDEASSIADVLNNALPFVDQWFIYDTGSTDGTQEIIQNVAARYPTKTGKLEEGPFVDFSYARNKALEMAGDNVVFTLMLDGDWYIQDPENKLRASLEAGRDADTPGYMIRVNQTGQSWQYPSLRILRTARKIRYEGVVHEVPDALTHAIVDESASLMWAPTETNEAMSRARWERDLVLLQHEYDFSTPQNKSARTVFYLGQTYWCLRRWEEGLRYNVERANMEETWEQERYVAALRAADCADALNASWPPILALLLEVQALVPRRAEALVAIAEHYNAERKYTLAAYFTLLAERIPMPPVSGFLFTERLVYEERVPALAAHSYWYINELERGLEYTKQLLKAKPDNMNAKRTMWYYLNSLDLPIPDDIQAARDGL